MMAGMQSLTSKEMKEVKGGYCNNVYGYDFCCPACKDDVQYLTDVYLAESQEKASAYMRFIYVYCDWKHLP